MSTQFEQAKFAFAMALLTAEEPLSNDEVATLRRYHLRPSEAIQGNFWFTMYWAWLYYWDEFKLPLVMGIGFLTLMLAANVYYWLKNLILAFI